MGRRICAILTKNDEKISNICIEPSFKDQHGFIAHIYDVSEAVSPAVTLGFLGTDARVGELCQYFKEQITQFVVDIFNTKRVRYTTLDELAEDVWVVLENRTDAARTRLATELIPA
ncbi:unnamed protein product [Heligmosomoides polygyrus]|uniref:6-carboxytetrahydropterin synthase n=1 Tax=Heligmosomoides polygyrus TaxID=6339 RepID=A0A183F4U3_HELPZ|nr:unnamed protein product [Heligmosomoides polygyrus]